MPRLLAILPGSLLFFGALSVSAGNGQLPTGPRLHPAGRQVRLSGTLPLGLSVTPKGREVLVTCGGALQGLATVDAQAGTERGWLSMQARVRTPGSEMAYRPTGSTFQGLCLSPDGATLYAAGGGTDRVLVFSRAADGALTPQGALPDAPASFPAGIALNGPGTRLYAANNLSDTLAVFDTVHPQRLGLVPVGGYPLAVAALGDGSKVYVTSERDGFVSVVDPQKMTRLGDIVTGSHPDALRLTPDGRRLFVANGDSDTVSVVDTRTDRVLRTILLRPAGQRGLPGATPTGLALSPDARTLYVTLADLNAVAVLALNPRQRRRPLAGIHPDRLVPDGGGRAAGRADAVRGRRQGRGGPPAQPAGAGADPSRRLGALRP